MCSAYGWDDSAEILRDIQADYLLALHNHQRRGNRRAIKIFTDLVAWVDIRVSEMIGTLQSQEDN